MVPKCFIYFLQNQILSKCFIVYNKPNATKMFHFIFYEPHAIKIDQMLSKSFILFSTIQMQSKWVECYQNLSFYFLQTKCNQNESASIQIFHLIFYTPNAITMSRKLPKCFILFSTYPNAKTISLIFCKLVWNMSWFSPPADWSRVSGEAMWQ